MSSSRRSASLLLGIYLAFALFATLTALPLDVPPPNPIPLATIVTLIATQHPLIAAAQIAGNLLVFSPIGLLGPGAVPWLDRWWRIALVTALLAGTIELAQLWLIHGRHADVDDLILNVAGAVLGYLTRGAVFFRATPPPRGASGRQ